MEKGLYINDSIHGMVYLTAFEKKIIGSVGFNRLHDVYQNSTVYLTFPSNRTKRFEHSIGTLKLCNDMFFRSVLNSNTDTLSIFFSDFKIELTKCLKSFSKTDIEDFFLARSGDGKIGIRFPVREYSDETYKLIPSNVNKEDVNVYIILMQSIRIAALLHDIGHPPYSHTIESAMEKAYEDIEHKPENLLTKRQQEFRCNLASFFSTSDAFHESMGKSISNDIIKSSCYKILEVSQTGDQEEYDKVCEQVLIWYTVKKIFADEGIFKNLHTLIDSPLDGDRLDYVTRDVVNSGMTQGKIDYSRIINEFKIFIEQEENDSRYFKFLPSVKSLTSIEDFFSRRFNEYKDIIGHHRVRKMDYLLSTSVEMLINEYLLSDKDIEKTKEDISVLWKVLDKKNTSYDKNKYLSLWNDSWLMNFLKIYYYENEADADKELIVMLKEIVTNEKMYVSYIKRSEDFLQIDDGFRNFLKDEEEHRVREIITLAESLLKTSSERSTDKIYSNIDPTLNAIISFMKLDPINNNNGQFLQLNLKNWYHLLSKTPNVKKVQSFDSVINSVVRDIIAKTDSKSSYFILPNNIKYKNTDDVFLYHYNDDFLWWGRISNIQSVNNKHADRLPMYYIYVYNGNHILPKKSEFLTSIGKNLSDALLIEILEWLNAVHENLKN